MLKATIKNACHINYFPVCNICGEPITARTDSTGHHAWACFDTSKDEFEVYFVHHGRCHKVAMRRIEAEGGIIGDVELERFLLAMLRELAPTPENIRDCLIFRPHSDEPDQQLYQPRKLFTY